LADIAVTASFNSGEWSPSLFARVDIAKYRSAAALLQNFFVDYRGGASTRAGTQFIAPARDSTNAVRLIPFQASYNLGYVLEFGQNYIRFMYQGSPVLENAFAISGATQANPCVLTITGNNYAVGDMVYAIVSAGMTQLNGRYFTVAAVTGASVTINDMFGNPVNSTAYSPWIGGTGGTQRLYTISTPYNASDLAKLKFAQSQAEMVLTHTSYQPMTLTLSGPLNWVLSTISFGSTASAPTLTQVTTTLPGVDIFTTPNTLGQSYYSYEVTSIDANGQESLPSNIGSFGPVVDIRTYGGSNQIYWNAVPGAKAYNVYEADISYFGVQPAGVFYGFVGFAYGTTFIDSNIVPDFSEGPPQSENPFVGEGIAFATVLTPGSYTTVPGVVITGGSPTVGASAYAVLTIQGAPTITAGGTGHAVGDVLFFGNSIVMVVLTVSSGVVASLGVRSPGAISSGSVPSNPIPQISSTGTGTGCTISASWGVGQIVISNPGLGFTSQPSLFFTSGSATGDLNLTPTGNGNPGVCGFFQQRLTLAATTSAPSTFWMSTPGFYFNFNTHNPIIASDAITGTLVANTLSTIKSIVSVPAGMLMLTDKAAWAINGGFNFSGVSGAVTPTTIVAAQQSFIGANDMPPITTNWDILYVESNDVKVRDLTYNIYFNTFTGIDISVWASHLFYGFTLLEWAWAEQPFYEVWAIRNDGVMLTLTFLKEQEFVGWSHQITQGAFSSVASVTEPSQESGTVNSVYVVVERAVEGQLVKYIERVVERVFPQGVQSAWCVDSGAQYNGPPILAFQGAENLSGLTVTGLATDDRGNVTVIAPFVMPLGGAFTLPAPPSPAVGYVTVTIGLPYTCQLQTLPLDLGEPSVQGKAKKINNVDVRVHQTLGLSIGPDFQHLVPMQDLIVGNVGSMLIGQPIQRVSGLFTGDARTFIGPTYTIPGQYCIQQSLPYPATILGVFPNYTIGDDR
jgi:hypothetical protein